MAWLKPGHLRIGELRRGLEITPFKARPCRRHKRRGKPLNKDAGLSGNSILLKRLSVGSRLKTERRVGFSVEFSDTGKARWVEREVWIRVAV
jgi:hypothetical protein